MGVKLALSGYMIDALPRTMRKKHARDMKVCFAVQVCFVEAVFSTFYRELWGDESEKEGGYNAPP